MFSDDFTFSAGAVISTVGSFLLLVIGWVWHRLVKRIDELEVHKMDVTKNYVTKDYLDEVMKGMFIRWDKMEAKLDQCLSAMAKAATRDELELAKHRCAEKIERLEARKADKPRGSYENNS